MFPEHNEGGAFTDAKTEHLYQPGEGSASHTFLVQKYMAPLYRGQAPDMMCICFLFEAENTHR